LIREALSVKDYVALVLREIRSQRLSGQTSNRQPAFPLEILDTGTTDPTTM
jgi:hypothetical protein